MSKAVSSSRRCEIFGSADSSCSGMLIRSMVGVEVSTLAAVSVAQPAPASVESIRTSNYVASMFTTFATWRSEAAERRTDWIDALVSGSTR